MNVSTVGSEAVAKPGTAAVPSPDPDRTGVGIEDFLPQPSAVVDHILLRLDVYIRTAELGGGFPTAA